MLGGMKIYDRCVLEGNVGENGRRGYFEWGIMGGVEVNFGSGVVYVGRGRWGMCM